VIKLRRDSLFWREMEGEIVALDATGSEYFSANATGASLWKRLEQGATQEELVEELCRRYRVEREEAEADVHAFLEQLSAEGLLER
jgi:hypothetical protein